MDNDETSRGDDTTEVKRTSDREIRVTRTFDAPADRVFAAWTDPDLFMRWWIPKSFGVALQSCELDVRTGGTYRLSFGEGMDFFGRYVEVIPPNRIVWTNEESGPDGPVTTVTLTEKEGRTVLTVSECHASKEALDADGGGSFDAMPETLTQLDELLAEITS